jgi:hypothetical protein
MKKSDRFAAMIKNKLLLAFLCCVANVFAQNDEFVTDKNFNNAILIAPAFTAQFPLLDMQKRFGYNSQLGGSLSYQLRKHWHIGVDAGFMFGTKVKEDSVLNKISTSQGNFVGVQNGTLVNVFLQERGFTVKAFFGKTIVFGKNPLNHSGLLLLTGVGFMQHKILIDVRKETIPQLNSTYRKGYDRMANGPVISQFIGGIYLKHKKWLSFYGGVQADIAFTQSRRVMNFDTQTSDTQKRIDLLIGIKFGWIIPVFKKKEMD